LLTSARLGNSSPTENSSDVVLVPLFKCPALARAEPRHQVRGTPSPVPSDILACGRLNILKHSVTDSKTLAQYLLFIVHISQ